MKLFDLVHDSTVGTRSLIIVQQTISGIGQLEADHPDVEVASLVVDELLCHEPVVEEAFK